MQFAISNRRAQAVLYDKKWIKFLRMTWLFRYIPFVDLVFAAGSMATGDVDQLSDFDVIVGARQGRIFTARFFAVLFFGFFGWRRTRLSYGEFAADKVCLNHFVTPAAYRLAPPYTDSWRELYRNLVPLYGAKDVINQFWAMNTDLLKERVTFRDDLRYDRSQKKLFVLWFEFMLCGYVGDVFERVVRSVQILKIERGLSASLGVNPRIIYTDNELEFHPDRRKFDAGETS